MKVTFGAEFSYQLWSNAFTVSCTCLMMSSCVYKMVLCVYFKITLIKRDLNRTWGNKYHLNNFVRKHGPEVLLLKCTGKEYWKKYSHLEDLFCSSPHWNAESTSSMIFFVPVLHFFWHFLCATFSLLNRKKKKSIHFYVYPSSCLALLRSYLVTLLWPECC